MGAGLEFAGHQWGAPEDADQRRNGSGEQIEALGQEVVVGQEAGDGELATALAVHDEAAVEMRRAAHR